MEEFISIYLVPSYEVDLSLNYSQFGVEISLGCGHYINVYTLDRSIVEAIADLIGRDNVAEIPGDL